MNTSPHTTDRDSEKEQILTAIVSRYFDDLDFIERINDLTFHQKRKLQAIRAGKPHYSHHDQSARMG